MSSASPSLATWETARPKAAYWSAAVLVAPLFLLALYIYGHGLGKRSLSIDELYHVYAADSLLGCFTWRFFSAWWTLLSAGALPS